MRPAATRAAPGQARVLALCFPLDACASALEQQMQAFVYKSLRKADTYVYLAGRDDFGRIPEAVRAGLGRLDFVLEVALVPGRRLAREDADVVRANLAGRGFHLQMPPRAGQDPMSGDWGTDA